uniref:Uncharacterized protein n=1 Tax=Arundo donax TaxID=35708 RepID=A0A0A9BXK3_ARUDO
MNKHVKFTSFSPFSQSMLRHMKQKAPINHTGQGGEQKKKDRKAGEKAFRK